MRQYRKCRKCGCEIKEKGLGNRFKSVGRETRSEWILRHVKQLFSMILHGFAKPEIEGYIELCDRCYRAHLQWLNEGSIPTAAEISKEKTLVAR